MIRRYMMIVFFFFNDTATTEIYTLSLHDALPISPSPSARTTPTTSSTATLPAASRRSPRIRGGTSWRCTRWSTEEGRSEEHTSELQSRQYLVCRLLLEKKKHISSPYCSLVLCSYH